MASFLMFLLAVVWLLYQVFSQKPCPPGYRFDLDKKTEDILNDVSFDERERRQRKGYYYSPKEEIEKRKEEKKSYKYIPKYEKLNVVDIERYENDRKIFGEEYTEQLRQGGAYLIKK